MQLPTTDDQTRKTTNPVDNKSRYSADLSFTKHADISQNKENQTANEENNKYNLNQRSTFFITAISNKLTQHATALLKSDFDIGLVDWRCIATLAYERKCSAAMICKISGMNKSLVSQSLGCLRELGYVVPDEGSVSKKPEVLKLSEIGIVLHQEIIKKVHHFEAELTEGLKEEDRSEFIRLLTHVYKNMKSS